MRVENFLERIILGGSVVKGEDSLFGAIRETKEEVDLGNTTTDEVVQAAWMNRSQIKELSDANMFVDTLEYFFTEVDK